MQRHGGHADHDQQRARRGQRAGRAGPVHRLRHQGDADLGGPGILELSAVNGENLLSHYTLC